jgi:hypothetical protein
MATSLGFEGTYRVGRGNAMTAEWLLLAAGSHAEPPNPLRWCPWMLNTTQNG